MPTVVREDIDRNHAVITVTIENKDYAPKVNEELKKASKKAQMKGFRPGKMPTALVNKMYGKSLLGEVVSEMLQQQMTDFVSSASPAFLGNPIAVDGFKQVEFDISTPKDYVFKFDVGVAPEFEVIGLTGSEFGFCKVLVPEEKVQEQMMYCRRNGGERHEVEGPVGKDDLVTFNATELDGDAPKEGGWKSTFKVLASVIANEDTLNELLTKSKGDSIRFNVYELEGGRDRDFVKKHLLHFTDMDLAEETETGDMYEAIIEGIERLEPAEVTEEFLADVFGEDVKTEAEALDLLRQHIGRDSMGGSNSLLFTEMRERLIEQNRANMPLPEEFLKRWLKASHDEKPESLEKTLHNFDKFLDSVRWTLISNKLAVAENIKISEQEIMAFAQYRIQSYFGGYGDASFIKPMVDRIMEDPDQVNSLMAELLNDKLFKVLREQVRLNEVAVTAEELNERLEAAEEKSRYEELPAPVGETPVLEPAETEALVEA